MTTIPQLPLVTEVGAGDLLPLSQDGTLYAATVGQLVTGLQAEIILPTGDMLGRVSTGAGAPEPVSIGAGLDLAGGSLSATGADHAKFPLQATLSLTDQVIMNAAGTPALLDVVALRGLFTAGTGITIDSNGTLAVTVSSVAGPQGSQGAVGPAGLQGPAGPQGPQGTGLQPPSTGNSLGSINAGDYVAIWQNGANGWITYQQLIGGQTIDQLPSAGPAQDSDQILVAQNSNSLSSQTFSAIWSYIASKLPTTKTTVVELTVNTVLDGTSHNGRVLVASQPLTLSANFANMGSGFSCRVINLSSGMITMGTGITAGSGVNALPPGMEAILTGLTYSGGSVVWWGGAASTSPSLTVASIAAPAASIPFIVSGNLYNDTPSSLDYSYDGSTWVQALSPMITTSSYSFQVPGLMAGTYVLRVRDHANPAVAGASNSFTVQAPALTMSPVAGSATVGTSITLAGAVVPAAAAVQAGISSSATMPPASFTPGTVSQGNWSVSLTPTTSGTIYLWAQQTNDVTVTAISSAVSVTSGSLTVTAPASASAGQALAVSGTVTPAGTDVTVQLATQSNTPPSSAGTAASTSGGSFSANLTPGAAGTYYVWAQTQSGASAVSGPVAVTAQSSVSYTINQPGTTSYVHGSGSIAVNGSINPAQNIPTQVAISVSDTTPPSSGWQTAAIIDNNALWAVYLPTPAQAGSYYIWVETAAGTSPSVSSFTLDIT